MNNKQQPDTLYATPRESVGSFRFDESVASVFSDMIERSVPGYRMILEMIAVISARHASDGSHCYDLGCSLGASTLAIRHGVGELPVKIIAVDNSPAMIERCQALLEQDQATAPVTLACQDILDTTISNASLTVMNFTLQFIAEADRCALLQRIANNTLPGGALVLSEKIRFDDAEAQHLQTELHHGFKKARGYSDMEIAQKRTALENVLLPNSVAEHRARLLEAGFQRVELWFQCFNFVSLLAIK